MTLTELAIKRPSLIVVLFAALGVLGIFGYFQLKYELLPKIAPPILTITTPYPGASPSEVENNVTKPIEDAVYGLDKISSVRAASSEGVSIVTVELEQDANVDFSLQDAQRKVNQILATLPKDIKSPVVTKFALDEVPVLRIGVTSTMPSREFYQFLKDHVQPSISNVAGVGQVIMVGGDEREIRVNLDMQKLRSYGLSIKGVNDAIRNANMEFPTGNLKDGAAQYVVRVAGKFSSMEELRNLTVGRSRQGAQIRLAEVADVQDGTKDLVNTSRINGKTSVGILVQKQSDANQVEVSKLVRTELLKLQKNYADIGLTFDIAQDGSTFTLDAADAVKHDLTLAIMLVAAVMFLFLHSIRNSVIVMIAIPASLVSTFLGMWLFGFTLNLMTLLALSLVIGILVDDSIVVLENIYHHLEKGEESRSAALKGRNEIGFAALSITLVDVVVFVPLSLTSGLIGNIMRQFAVVVVVATLMSLLVSFTVTPILASRFSRIERMTRGSVLGRFALWFEQKFKELTQYYLGLLRWALANRGKVALLTLAAFFGALALPPLGFIGNEFITQSDRGEFTVTLELTPGVSIEQTNQVTRQVEDLIAQVPEVKKVFTNVGVSSEGLLGQTSNNNSELNIALVPKEQRVKSTDQVGQEIKAMIQQMPGMKVRVNPIGIFGTANQTPIQIVVEGTELSDINKAAETVSATLAGIAGTTDIRLSSEEGKPESRVVIDRDKMAQLGLSVNDVGSTLRVALSGDDDSKFRDGQNEYDIRVMLDQFDRTSAEDLANLVFTNSKGEQIELQQFASVYQSNGPTRLERQDRNSAVSVWSQVIGQPSGTVVAAFRKAIDGKLPKGISLTYLGDEKNRSEGFGSLGLALLAAIIFVYMIMVALYDSYVYPFVVLFSIPVAMVGAFLALALTGKSLSIFSILGIIMLVGLVAKNAILLVDRTNEMKRQGLGTFEALLEAGQARIRPIFMTTLSMVIGMLPIAVAAGAGSEWKSGLAWALIGGLTSSMFLTLLLVPVVYSKVDEWRSTIPAFFEKPSALFRKWREARRARKESTIGGVPALEMREAK
ncbi:MAG TPA: efflux RND transporter permease subunit [Chloroflexota bacterium]